MIVKIRMEAIMDTGLTFPPKTTAPPARDPVLWRKAQELEAAFLAEMLKAMQPSGGEGNTGVSGFGGGIGEEQFGSFLREGQARQMVRRGGIGLAEQIFRSLSRGVG
jgi:Rod binding domain-containing protein